jgi:hypothetical protein
VPIIRRIVSPEAFVGGHRLPYSLRRDDFAIAMQNVYDFLFDVNRALSDRHIPRFDDIMRPAAMSGMISDMLTASIGRHSRALVQNKYFNGHPVLIVRGAYPNDAIKSGIKGVEVKTTVKTGGAVDMHGARDQCMSVFVYAVDRKTEPAIDRAAMKFVEVYIAEVTRSDFRKNARGELGTRTATLDKDGVKKLRAGKIYDARKFTD